MQVKKSISSSTKCNGCGFKIKIGDDMLSLGSFGYRYVTWVKLCRNCVHKAHQQLFNYTPEYTTTTNTTTSQW